MPTSKIAVSEGSGKNLATHSITEDTFTKELQRVVLANSSGVEEGTVTNPVNVLSSTKVPLSTGTYATSSFRIAGVAALSQVLCTIRNNAGAKVIALRRISIDVSQSAAAVDLAMGTFRLWPNTGVTPSGGTAPTKHKFDSAYPTSQAATEILFASSSDTVATAIIHAIPGSTPMRQQSRVPILTAVGAVPFDDCILQSLENDPIYVRSGETVLIAVVGASNDVTTRNYIVKLTYEEI